MRRRILIGVATIFALLVVLALGASQFRLSALQEPGAVETYAATAAKRWFVGQGAREVEVPTVVDEAKGVARGKLLYGANCSFCHGVEGKRPLQFGLWMYPRSPDLNESLIRQWTDAELFLDHPEWHPHDRNARVRPHPPGRGHRRFDALLA